MDEQRAWIRSRRRKRLRIVAVILCMCLLVTTRADILETLSTFASEWKDSTVYVSGFVELPEEVRAQTVPLGAGIEELSLPDTLEAFEETPEEEDKPGDADKPGEGSGDTENPDDGEGGTENPGDETGETGNSDDGEGGAENPGDGNGETGNPGDGEDGTENPGDGNGETGNPGDGEDDTENPGDGSGDAGNADDGTGDAGESGDGNDGGSGDAGNPDGGSDDGSGDAGNPDGGSDDGSGDAGNADEGNSGEGEPETQNDSAPADDEGGAETADEMAKGVDGVQTVRRGVFVMPVYLSEPVDVTEPQTMERKKESVMIKGVTWQSEPAYDGNVEGTYVFTAVLPEGYALAEGASLPQITVTVQGTDPVVQELLARIAALPEAEEYLADEPDVEEEGEYEAWMDELSTYTAEALDLWEMYETFTEEQRAQVPMEALVKLAAWVELAGQLAEGSQVMAAAETGGTFGDGLTWKLEGNTLTISGSGAMPDWAKVEDTPWYGSRGDIKSVIIENGVTNIGSHAFLNCSALTSIKIPNSVTSIGDKAFYDCKSLISVTIPNNVTSIGSSTFQNCESLSSVAFIEGGSIPTLGWGCFYGCPCVRGTGRGISIPSCKYLTKSDWLEYKNNVTIREPHTLTHTENGTERYWACSVCQTQFSETINVENCDIATAVAGENYTVTFTPNSGYAVPTEVTVTIGGTALGSGDYAYDSAVGKLTIPIGMITGDVIITATAVEQALIDVTLKKDGSLWTGQTVTLEKSGVTYGGESTENGIYQFEVPKGGTYRIFLDNKPTGGNFNTDQNYSRYSETLYYLTVIYNANGADGTVPPKRDCYCGRKGSSGVRQHSVDSTLPMRKQGCVQIGWSEASDGSSGTVKEIVVNDGEGNVREKPINLYPVFAPAKVIINAENCAHDGAAEVAASGDYIVTFTPKSGYDVPAGVTVEIGDTTLGSGDYIYNGTTGTLTIPREKITGNVTITATAVDTQVTTEFTLKKDGSLWSGQTVTLKKDGATYEVYIAGSGIYRFKVPKGGTYDIYLNNEDTTFDFNTEQDYAIDKGTLCCLTVTYNANGAGGESPLEKIHCCMYERGNTQNFFGYRVEKTLPLTKPGYVQTGWSETENGSAVGTIVTVKNSDGTVRETPITLYPVFAPAKVTITAENCTHNGAGEVAASGDYTVTFTPETGHDVPAGVTVEIGDTTLGSGDYTYNGTTGTLTIPRENITGNVTITVTAGQHSHSLTYTANSGAIRESCSKCDHLATATFDGSETKTYTGSEIKPFVVRYSPNADAWLGGEEKKPVISYTGNTNAGTATATLSVPGESASVSRTFTIAPKSLEDASVTATLPFDSYQYNGKAITPVVTARDSAIDGGMILVEDRDYTVTYADNIAVGTNTAKVTVTGTGNYTGVRTLTFTIQDKAPEVSGDDLDFSGGTVELPDDIKDKVEKGEVEICDSNGNKITPNPDGSLPVEPGTTIKIKYPGSDKETVIQIPPRPAAPEAKKVTVTDTTATVSNPAAGEEYVLVAREGTPDWSKAKVDTTFTGLTPNTAYDLYVRKQATKDSFASEPAKTQMRTSVTIKEPETGGAGAGKDGNDVSEGKPSADGGSVTYTGTCEKGSTPVIIVDGKEIVPEITWDADGKKGTWSYTVPVEDGDFAVGIRVEFKDRVYKGLEIVPGSLSIHADNAANQSAEKLLDYLKAHCAVKLAYNNGTSDDATNGAVYTVNGDFNAKGAVYKYAVEAGGDTSKTGAITLTVNPVHADVKKPDALTRTKQSGGYTKAEVDAWLPASVTVAYTGDGDYAQRPESRSVTWDTDALGADFGATAGSKIISGTVDMPVWATLDGKGNTVSIGIEFVDRSTLTDDQMNLSLSGWTYGAQTAPAPKGSVTVTDTEQTYSYRYSADNGRSWVTAGGLPKSGSGNIIPGDYQVEMTYSGRNYTGKKTAVFTVVQKPVTAEKGTLAVENRNYDGTTKATLKAGGKPALVGAIANDDVSLSGTLNAVFTNKGPKKDIPVTVTGFALTGRDAGYYKLVNTTLTLKATINNKDGSSPSSGSSSGSSGNTSGGDSGSGDNGNSGGDSGNSGNTGTGGSTGSGGNSGTGGNTGTGGNKGTGGNTGSNGGTTGTGNGNTGGTGKGSTGSGNITGTGKGDTSGTGKGSTGSGNTTGTGKGTSGTGKGGTDKGTSGNGSSSMAGNNMAGNGGIGSSGKGGTGKGGTSGTGRASTDSTGSGSGSTGNIDSGTGNGDTGAQQAGDGQQTKSVTVQTVQAAADDGRIVISGETEMPVAIGTLTEDAPGATRLLVGEGTVTVTVVCEDDQYTVGMNDATAVANAVLTPEQIQRVDAGESLEIRVDIKNISQSIPPQDRETVEKGYEAYEKYLPELTRGGYVDISVYMKTGEDGWNAVSETTEPLEVVIGIPEGLRGDGREYYIIRAHEGKYTLLNDMDAVPETITIVTDMFSSYAIAYREADAAGAGNGETAYGLFHVSPRFLGIVSLICLTVAAAGIIVVIIVLRRKKSCKRESY